MTLSILLLRVRCLYSGHYYVSVITTFVETGINADGEYSCRDRVGEDDIIGTATIPVSAISAPGEDGEYSSMTGGADNAY